jgi:hypothetical protein
VPARAETQLQGPEWRIADVLHTVEQGREWADPGHEAASVLVRRQNSQVHYRNLELVERDALVIVPKGARFAPVCEAVAAHAEEHNRVTLIGQLMARWLADGTMMAADSTLVTTMREHSRRADVQADSHFGKTSTALSASKR